MLQLTIAKERPDAMDIRALLAASDRYHAALYPAESNHLVDIDSLMAPPVRFLVARRADGIAVGCGALILSQEAGLVTAELKRMWVDPATRGLGLGRRMLAALEMEARRNAVNLLRLETGISQPEALGLYRAAGYFECGPFGAYKADPLSVFMEKVLISVPVQDASR